MAALILKQIERGQVSFSTSDTTKTVTLSTTLTDTTKAIIIHSARADSGSARNFCVTGRIISTTQIQFDRVASPTVAAVVEWQVQEFISGITVQQLYVNQDPTTTINTSITAVDTTKTFAIVSGAFSTLTTFGATNNIYADLLTSTNLATVVATSVISAYVSVQVVQIDDAEVQKISGTFAVGTTLDIAVTTIDMAKTFWFFGASIAGTMTNDRAPYLSYVNSTTLRFTRASTGLSHPLRVYVVSLSAGVSVQNISTVIASGSATVSPAITEVLVDNTTIFINGIYQEFASVNHTTAEGANNTLTLSGLTTTAFTATRATSPALAATTNVQVLSWTTSTCFILIQEE